MEKRLIEILTDEEILLFKMGERLIIMLATKLKYLTVDDLDVLAGFLSIDIQVMLGRIVEADGGMK